LSYNCQHIEASERTSDEKKEAKKPRREAEVVPFGRYIYPPVAGKKRTFKAFWNLVLPLKGATPFKK